MHYNQFTIDYIKAIRRNFKIEINSRGEASVLYDELTDDNIVNLRNDLRKIWTKSGDAIDIVRTRKDAKIQAGLFGIINDLDTALKVGFLLGNRVVLIDYLYERILLKKNPRDINRSQLGVLASSLVSCLELAQTGRIVIIPTPFGWFPKTKEIISEVAEKGLISVETMSLLNMLSITKECQLHPYTIAESAEEYSSIINHQIDVVDVIGKDGGAYAYEGIVGGLLSERLLNEDVLKIALNVPLNRYQEIIAASSDFYRQYLSYITSGGSLDSQNNISDLRDQILQIIKDRDKKYIVTAARIGTGIGGVSSAALGFLGTVTVVSATLGAIGAFFGLSGSLTSLITGKDKEGPAFINVFHKLSAD